MTDILPVGIAEIADRLNVPRRNVDMWLLRGTNGFPAHKWTVGGRRAWEWSDVATWAAERGYLG